MESERFEIRPGAAVVGIDGEAGRLKGIVVSPRTGYVRGLIVRRGLLIRKDIVVPVEAVVGATEGQVQVRLTDDELDQMPEYREEQFSQAENSDALSGRYGGSPVYVRKPGGHVPSGLESAASGQVNASSGGRQIRSGQRVICLDGEAGTVRLVLLDPASRRVTHFVVRRGRLNHRDIVVAIEWVSEITKEALYLDLKEDELDLLPEYRPDEDIAADVLDKLWYGSELGPGELQLVSVRVHNGVVELSGHTRTEPARYAIESEARKVRGVLDVVNHIESLEELARRSIRQGSSLGRSGRTAT
jgi:uncharacterized protein YrrD